MIIVATTSLPAVDLPNTERRLLKRCTLVPIPVIRKIAKVTVTNVPDVTEMVIFVKIVEMVKLAKKVEIGQMVK